MDAAESSAEPAAVAMKLTRRRRGTRKSREPSTQTMEQMLWDAAYIRGEGVLTWR